jgi:uncharacterized protein involved in exopolysaccharide biosynthesis
MMDKAMDPRELPLDAAARDDREGEGLHLSSVLVPVRRRWRLVVGATVLAGAAGAGGSFLITPKFTSTTTFLPPQQQNASSSALASLGALAALAGATGAAVKSPADQYISLMQSVTVSDRIIDRFQLMKVYDAKLRLEARKTLGNRVAISLGKKDGLITVAVDDESPQRAAQMANQYVEELRRMTSTLAVSEAQQRRVFFEGQMQEAKTKLIAAQNALQQSGFAPGALKAEPRAAAEQYAQLRAQEVAAEVKLQTLRNSLAETAPQVTQQLSLVNALRAQLADLEGAEKPESTGPDYVGKYREFKYQETLFDLMTKQYELARVDEAREGALIQVVDPALPAERKTTPKRAVLTAVAAIMGLVAAVAWVSLKSRRSRAARG